MKKKLITGIMLLVLPLGLLVGHIHGRNDMAALQDNAGAVDEEMIYSESAAYGDMDPLPATPVE